MLRELRILLAKLIEVLTERLLTIALVLEGDGLPREKIEHPRERVRDVRRFQADLLRSHERIMDVMMRQVLKWHRGDRNRLRDEPADAVHLREVGD